VPQPLRPGSRQLRDFALVLCPLALQLGREVMADARAVINRKRRARA
jgi:hypothetical protein